MEQISIQNTPKPIIRRYFSGIKYLTDYYDYRKKADHFFSYELWAAELGLKSKSTLRMICKGERNISEDFIEIFSAKEKLNSFEKEYFIILSRLQNNKNTQIKKIYLDKLAELSLYSDERAEIKNIQLFLSDLNLMKAQVIIAFIDFEANSNNIKKLLNINSHQFNKIIRTLESMNLIEPYFKETTDEKFWKTTSRFFSVTDEAYLEAMNLYHLNTTKETAHAIVNQDLYKKFKSLNIALSESDFIELNQMMDNFNNKLKVKYGDGPLRGKRLYKINLQAYPVSQKYD